MNRFVSPFPSDVGRSAESAPSPDPANVRDLAARFEALVMREAFAPLSRALGFFGDSAVTSALESVARSERGGLADALTHALSAEGRS
jgi:hypothetical protein